MADLTKEEVTRRCQDLVYKVAYAFYDSPYIIMLRILNEENVMTEKKLSDMLNIGPNDVRKYLGLLHVHRLVKRHVNKEKATLTQWQQRQLSNGQNLHGVSKSRDVIYWYLDYREFSDVVKYRIAMMRRAIDDKIKNEVGRRGTMCPNCGKVYDLLDMGHTFDPSTSAFYCENCGAELVEDDPTLHGDDAGGQDRMQRFNVATTPIRDALKSIEGARLPTVNIIAWIARNVTTETAAAADAAGETRKLDVVIGAEDDSVARAKEVEAQRAQNALPVWYTESTVVTGDKTRLGTKDAAAAEKAAADGARRASTAKATADDDDALAAHYANMDEDGEEDEMEEAELGETPVDTGDNTPADTPAPGADVRVMVNGVAKRLVDVTEADEENMTPEEYEAYFEATSAQV